MSGSKVHIPAGEAESCNSADLITNPDISLPPAIITMEPRTPEPNKRRSLFITAQGTQRHMVFNLYTQVSNPIIKVLYNDSGQGHGRV